MLRLAPLLLLALAACNGERLKPAGAVSELPGSDTDFWSIEPDDSAGDLARAVDEALDTPGKAPDNWRFIVIRAMDRHDPALPNSGMHVVIGAGVELPLGAMRIRRGWYTSGQVDGTNEQLERWGIAIAVERGATQPFAPEVVAAIRRFVGAIAPRLELHPDCVVAMGEVPFTRDDPADAAERALAADVRASVPLPPVSGSLTVVTADRRIPVAYERRETDIGRMTGMMMRKRFDGTDQGVLFVYPHRAQRRFYMRNCFVRIDLAFLKNGRIEQIVTMPPQPGIPTQDLPGYESNTAVRYALEMPGGWFADHGVVVGDRVEGLAE
jgi:uncharacterized membrane protein (UPF0127 family)